MEIDIICEEKIATCSYIYWHKIKTNIIKATIEYIEKKFEADKNLYKITDPNDENYIGIGSYYDFHKNIINDMINNLNKDNNKNFYYVNMDILLDNTMKIFMRLTSELKIISSLNYFELGGLFALCNQSDCDGCYSPGSSLDICLMLDKIKPFMLKYEGFNYVFMEHYSIYEVFEHSHKNLMNVFIC